MSEHAPVSSPGLGASVAVRRACAEDVPGVVIAVQELLLELGSVPPPAAAFERVACELSDGAGAGAVLVAQAGEQLVGVLAASWQLALHVPGRYATIQDLWVDPAWRRRAVGAQLIDALLELARARGLSRIEVGLPREDFPRLAATASFYRRNGFESLGPRMRRALS
jgi:GNAT superfamily N-acetyltransferase